MTELTLNTRARLLHAAQEVTEEGGYGAASVVAIARRAGVATGTLYRHFPSKAELFVELFRSVCAREIAAMRAAIARPGTAADRIEDTVATFAGRALRSPRLAWALIAEPVDPLVDVERLAYRRAYRQALAELVQEGVTVGQLPAQDADLTAAAIVGGVGEALLGPVSPLAADPPAAEQTVAALRRFARRACGTPEPR